MPLISKSRPASDLVPERERSRFKRLSISLSHSIYKSSASSSRSNINDESMDDSIAVLPRPQPLKRVQTAPLLPPKSELRASRILDTLTTDLKSLARTNVTDVNSTESLSNPLEEYLSSEEDASEGADDYYEESIVEVDSDSLTSQKRRNSQQDTARVVSYTFVGKPSIVEISNEIPQPPVRQSYIEPKDLNKLRPNSMQTVRPSSANPSGPKSPSAHASMLPPPRKSSRARPPLTITHSMTGKDSFLDKDPFPTPIDSAIDLQSPMDVSSPRTPSEKWRIGLKHVTRSFSFAKKPSIPKISAAYKDSPAPPGLVRTATTPCFPHTPITPRPISAESQPEMIKEEEDAEVNAGKAQEPVNYQDIVNNAKVGPLPPPPTMPAAKTIRPKSSLLGLGRRRSIRGQS